MSRQRPSAWTVLAASVIMCVTALITPLYAQDSDKEGLPIMEGPVSIQDAVAAAVKHNPSVATAGSELAAAKSRANMARAMTKPQLSATVFAGKSSMGDIVTSPPEVAPPDIFSIPPRTGVTGQATLMLPLYTGRKLTSAVKSADLLEKSASADRRVAELDVAFNTRVAYYQLLNNDAMVETFVSLVTESTERVRVSEAFLEEGKIAKYDLLRNETVLANARQQLVNAQRDAKISMINLKTSMGISQLSEISILANKVQEVNTLSLEELLAKALANRPELSSARSKTRSAAASVEAARGAYSPQVYGAAMEGFSSGSGDTKSGYTIGITVGIPLIDGGLRRSGVAERKAMLESARTEEKRLTILIQQDVYSAYAELNAAGEDVKLSEAAVDQATEDYRVIKLRAETGKTINVEVLDALMSLVQARNNRVIAIHGYKIANAKLLRAIGEPVSGDEQAKEGKQ